MDEAGITRAQGPQHDHDLHTRPQPPGRRGPKPNGPTERIFMRTDRNRSPAYLAVELQDKTNAKASSSVATNCRPTAYPNPRHAAGIEIH